jgi:hypothetical protein
MQEQGISVLCLANKFKGQASQLHYLGLTNFLLNLGFLHRKHKFLLNLVFMISGINLGHLGADLSILSCKNRFRGSFTP